MKKLLLAVLGIIFMTAILESCKDNNSNLLMPMKTSAGGGSTPANPAVVYADTHNNLAVMDSDGTHQTTISGFCQWPHWSPSNSVVYTGGTGTYYLDTLKEIGRASCRERV